MRDLERGVRALLSLYVEKAAVEPRRGLELSSRPIVWVRRRSSGADMAESSFICRRYELLSIYFGSNNLRRSDFRLTTTTLSFWEKYFDRKTLRCLSKSELVSEFWISSSSLSSSVWPIG